MFYFTFSPLRKPVEGRRFLGRCRPGSVNKAKTTYDTTASTRLKSQQARKSIDRTRTTSAMHGRQGHRPDRLVLHGCWNKPLPLSLSLSHPSTTGCMPCADRIISTADDDDSFFRSPGQKGDRSSLELFWEMDWCVVLLLFCRCVPSLCLSLFSAVSSATYRRTYVL